MSGILNLMAAGATSLTFPSIVSYGSAKSSLYPTVKLSGISGAVGDLLIVWAFAVDSFPQTVNFSSTYGTEQYDGNNTALYASVIDGSTPSSITITGSLSGQLYIAGYCVIHSGELVNFTASSHSSGSSSYLDVTTSYLSVSVPSIILALFTEYDTSLSALSPTTATNGFTLFYRNILGQQSTGIFVKRSVSGSYSTTITTTPSLALYNAAFLVGIKTV